MEDDLIMEEREEVMVSPRGGQVGVERGHFLKPIVTSVGGAVAAPSLSCSAAADYKGLPLKVSYQGCKFPQEKWKTWVDRMHALHHSTWKDAGIVDAIMNSKCTIHSPSDLIFGFVEKWCATTNSFVFPWGEATVTLEDVMVLGGYPVLGEWVLISARDEEMRKVLKKLQKWRSNIIQSESKNAYQGRWLNEFMGKGSEIEHEAFLAYWLSKFVFPLTRNTISASVLAIAVHLARGSKIALAPAVLSTIYKGLSLLKAAIVAARKSATSNDSIVQVTVPGLALVQVWIWERFPSLRPKPEPIGSKPGLARWHNLKLDSRLTIDSSGKDFQWRPYTTSSVGGIYRDDEQRVEVGGDLDEDVMGFVRCMRTSELVSLDCMEQYLPHRVAMQFGMDQDLPGHVARVNVNPEFAWRDYTRPIRDAEIYVPPRLSQPLVTARYARWWKKLNLGSEDSKIKVKQELFPEADDIPPPPGFSPKRRRVEDAGRFQDWEAPSSSRTRPGELVKSSSAAEYDNSIVPPEHDSTTRTEKQAVQLSSKAKSVNVEKKSLLIESQEDEEAAISGNGNEQGSTSGTRDERLSVLEKLFDVLIPGLLMRYSEESRHHFC